MPDWDKKYRVKYKEGNKVKSFVAVLDRYEGEGGSDRWYQFKLGTKRIDLNRDNIISMTKTTDKISKVI